MTERVKMVNWITGTEMDVPVHLVERFKAEGHRVVEAPSVVEPKTEKKPNRKTAKKK